MKTIDRMELERWTREQRAFALLDVLPDGPASLAEHLPHAHSRADFMEQMRSLKTHQEQPVVLYEATTASVHSGDAAGMLERAGFANVYHFVGPQTALHSASHAATRQGGSA